MMIPTEVILLPLYRLIVKMDLINNMWGIILPYLVVPMLVFFFRQYLMGIPKDFDEAAYLDGASHIQIFTKIIVPISKPIFASCAIVCLNHVWNEFLFANVFLESKKLMTIPIGLMTFKGDLRADYVTMLAGIIIASLPMIILFLCMSKQFVRGLTAGAVKG